MFALNLHELNQRNSLHYRRSRLQTQSRSSETFDYLESRLALSFLLHAVHALPVLPHSENNPKAVHEVPHPRLFVPVFPL